MNWDELSMSEKSDLMKTYIRNGVTSLDTMRGHFNSFATGGTKKTYKEWVSAMASKYPWLEMNSANAGYDYERYFNENYQDAISRLTESEPRHFTDKYKLPSHITFSDESVYSTSRNKGGRWVGDDMFMPSPANVERYPWLYKVYRPVSEEDIYSHRFATGGPEDEVDAVTGANRVINKNPYESKTGWFEWWMAQRDKQLNNTVKSANRNKVFFSTLSRKEILDAQKEELKRNYFKGIKDSKEFIIPVFKDEDTPIYNGFRNARVDEEGKEIASWGAYTDDVEDALNYLRFERTGTHFSGFHKGNYINANYYPELQYNRPIGAESLIHERNHAGQDQAPQLYYMIYGDKVGNYGKDFNYSAFRKQKSPLNPSLQPDNYLDNAKEIHSRLMEFRYLNNLDPKHIYTPEELQEMRHNEDIKDYELLERYNDDFMLHLLNEVAHNPTNKASHTAAIGGKLKIK